MTRHSKFLLLTAAAAVGCATTSIGGGRRDIGPVPPTGPSTSAAGDQSGLVNAAVNALSGITYQSQASAGIVLLLIVVVLQSIVQTAMHFAVIVLMLFYSHRREMRRIINGKV